MNHPEAGNLAAALSRFVAGRATTADHSALLQGVLDGTAVIASGERNVSIGGNASQAVIVTGNLNITINLGADGDNRLRDFLFQPKLGRMPPRPQFGLVGRSAALHEIKRRLGLFGKDGKALKLVVKGWPGLGKTSIVSFLPYDHEIAKYFSDGALWTWCGSSPRTKKELEAWGRALGMSDLDRLAEEDAIGRLGDRLAHSRMLLIIDDVWDPAHALPFVRAAGRECAVIITTRQNGIVDAFLPVSEYPLPNLTEADGLALLRILIPDIVASNTDGCLEVVRSVESLPLALHVAAHLLASEARLGWGVSDLLEKLRDGSSIIQAKAPVDRADLEKQTIPTVAALLQQSVDVLDQHTRKCFARLGPFAPKPATFGLRDLKAVWKTEDPKPTIRRLVSHGLLEPVEGRFQMHALLVALAKSLLA